jgi:hypothetical protein
VRFSTSSDSATSDVDFSSYSAVRNFAPGQTEDVVYVDSRTDNLNEGTERFNVSIPKVNNSDTITTASTFGQIFNVSQPGPVTSYTALIDRPNASTINNDLTSPSATFMRSKLGTPGQLTENCSPMTNSKLKSLMVTQDFGSFKATGLKPAIEAIGRIMARVKVEKPELFKLLGTAGMACNRKVRGGSDFSNHSWGIAIDITINNKSDKDGDGKTMVGLSELYPYFHAEKFYWGASFPREDSMHFEASKELIQQWSTEGRFA